MRKDTQFYADTLRNHSTKRQREITLASAKLRNADDSLLLPEGICGKKKVTKENWTTDTMGRQRLVSQIKRSLVEAMGLLHSRGTMTESRYDEKAEEFS